LSLYESFSYRLSNTGFGDPAGTVCRFYRSLSTVGGHSLHRPDRRRRLPQEHVTRGGEDQQTEEQENHVVSPPLAPLSTM
jgi:hypothetical protein